MASGYEKIYEYNGINIKYIFKKSDNYVSNNLIIIFSALGPKPVYNYVRTLEGIDENQLFILDDIGGRGCYYLGQYDTFYVEKAVIALINDIIVENGIDKRNVVCGGSSKGGTSALYFALKCGLGHVVIAEPQIKIAKYLIDYSINDVLDYMTNNNPNDIKAITSINSLLYELILENNFWPDLIIHAGKETYYFKEHIIDFLVFLRKENRNYELDLKDYDKHSELIKFYPDLLIDTVLLDLPDNNKKICIKNIDIIQDWNRFYLHVNGRNFNETAWYVYKDGKKIYTQWYTNNPFFEFTANEKGKYTFKAFAQNNMQAKIARSSSYFEVK